jgi:hypoxanthine phosphoribosyltransferase
LDVPVEGRNGVVVEDIVDTGLTMEKILQTLVSQKVKSVRVATLFHKPEALVRPLKLDYIGMQIPNDFIVGYGLDYDGLGRNLEHIYKIMR